MPSTRFALLRTQLEIKGENCTQMDLLARFIFGVDNTELKNPRDVVNIGGVEVSGSGGITGGTVTNSVTGQSGSFSMYQPSLAVNYLICADGTYPARN